MLQVTASSQIDSWTVMDDGQHNAFTDLVHWREGFWLVFVSSPSHFASRRSRIVLLHSPDAHAWKEIAHFDGDGEDIRDPKLAVVNDRLLLLALLNRNFNPLPYQTVCAASLDGLTWPELLPAVPPGWLLGHPKPSKKGDWVAPAHNLTTSAVRLFTSQDGQIWEAGATITSERGADETALEFLPDGRLLAVTRLEAGGGLFGHPQAGTLLSVAEPPYEKWTALSFSRLTRLDSPALFTHQERIYAVGRSQPHTSGPFEWQGSVLSRKRTSLYRVGFSGEGLTHLVDLPSAGDTAYAGVAVLNGQAYISYYSSRLHRDPAWLWGMFLPTSICMVMIPLGTSGEKTVTERIL
jgi:hypothetical protein